MRPLKGKLLAIVLGATAFMAGFGIAMAAIVQVSRDVGSSVEYLSVSVLSDDDLKLFHDAEGTNPVTSLNFELLDFQPPLEPRTTGETIFVRNDSSVNLTIIEPCREVFIDDVVEESELIGFVNPRFFTVEGDEIGDDDRPCDGSLVIDSGEMLMVEMEIQDIREDLADGSHNFTILFGGVGEE